jgi:DNA-binding MurR/RpiR family transcriptional regulator
MKSFQERIRASREGLSPSFEQLAQFLLDSYVHAALLTATELAHVLDLDTATVVRYAQHLGYEGYPDLQRAIRTKFKQELLIERDEFANSAGQAADQALRDLVQRIDLTRRGFALDQAEKLITVLDEAQRVILLAEGLSIAPANNLGSWLESAGYTIHRSGGSVSEMAHALAGSRKGDLVIVLDAGRDSSALARAVKAARGSEIRTAALVANGSSMAASEAEIVLAAHSSQVDLDGPILVETLIYALISMLLKARPGRYKPIADRVELLQNQLLGSVDD